MADTDLSPQDVDAAAATVAAEAGNQGPDGMTAVAHVIANRAAKSGMSPADVVAAPGQFSAWGSGAAPNFDRTSPAYKTARLATVAALKGQSEDPTNGATLYYNPKLVKQKPDWAADDTKTTQIGDHVFHTGAFPGQKADDGPAIDDIRGSGMSTAASDTAGPSLDDIRGAGTEVPPPAAPTLADRAKAFGDTVAGGINYYGNAALLGAQPALGGVLANVGQTLHNYATGDFSTTGGDMGNHVRDVMQGRIEDYEKLHPVGAGALTLAALIPDMVGKGVAKAGEGVFKGMDDLAGGALTKGFQKLSDVVAPVLTKTDAAGSVVPNVIAKVGSHVAGGAAQADAQALGESASRGDDAGGTANNVGVSTLSSIPFSLAGAGGSKIAALAQRSLPEAEGLLGSRIGSAATHGLVGGVTGGLGGAIAGGGTAAFHGGNVVEGALSGAVGGASAGAAGGAAHGVGHPDIATDQAPDARGRAVALDRLAAAGVTPDALRSAHPDALTADVTPGAAGIIKDASKVGSNVKAPLAEAYDERHNPADARARLDKTIAPATGGSLGDAESTYTDQHKKIANGPDGDEALKADRDQQFSGQATLQRVAPKLASGFGFDVSKQRGDFANYQEANKKEANRIFDDVATGEAVDSPFIRKKMQTDKDFRGAVIKAAEGIRQEHPNLDNAGWKLNPAYDDSADTAANPKAGEAPKAADAGTQAYTPDQFDEIAKYVKTGARPRMQGPNLLTRIRQLGGIKDLPQAEIPDIPGISRPNGKNAVGLDGMVERLHDEGYLGPRSPDGSRPDQQVLIDAVNNHTPDNPIHPDTPENQSILQKRSQMDDLHDMLSQIGVDPNTVSRRDLAQLIRSGGDTSHMDQEQTPEEKADYSRQAQTERDDIPGATDGFLNPDIKTPKYLPTDATLIRAKTNYEQGVGSDSTEQGERDKTAAMNNLVPHLDAAIPGYKEAREFVGERKQNEEWFQRGRDIFKGGADKDNLDTLLRDHEDPDTTDAMRDAFRKGLGAAYGDRIEGGPNGIKAIVNSPFHEGVLKMSLGDDGAKTVMDGLKTEVDARKTPLQDTPEQSHDKANQEGSKIWSSTPDPQQFAKDWAAKTPQDQEATKLGWKAELNSRLNDPKTGEQALARLQSPDHQAILETMFGPDQAKAMTDAAKTQGDFLKNQRVNVGAAQDRPTETKPYDIGGVVRSALNFDPNRMTPNVANATGEILAQPARDTADMLEARLKDAQTHQQKVDALMATLKPIVSGAAATGATLVRHAVVGDKDKPIPSQTVPVTRPRNVFDPKTGNVYVMDASQLDKRNALRGH